MTAKRTVFVAGAAGAIGRILCPLLVADGWTVVGTTRKPDRAPFLESLGVRPVLLDVYDAAATVRAIADAAPTAVIHQLTDLPAEFDPATLASKLDANARLREIGTRHLVDAAAATGVATFVVQSIAFAYAPGNEPFDESAPLNIDSADPIGAQSARAVRTMESLVLGGPFRGVVLRYGRLYGPGTWSQAPSHLGCTVSVAAAAQAARLALSAGRGIYNIVDRDPLVRTERAIRELGWNPAFRA